MAKTDYISQRRLDQFWENAKEYIGDELGRVITHDESSKAIVRVISYTSEVPLYASDGDFYINSEMDYLFVRDEDEWVRVEEVSKEIIFIADDTNHMYLWNGTEFVDVTGESVGNTLYVNNLTTDLANMTEKGVYDVVLSKRSGAEVYTLVVSVTYGPARPNQPRTIRYTQTLQNYRGYKERTKVNNGEWGELAEYQYVIEPMDNEDIDNLFE